MCVNGVMHSKTVILYQDVSVVKIISLVEAAEG